MTPRHYDKRPAEQKLLDIIRAAGRIGYAELAERAGISKRKVAERLVRVISLGIVVAENMPSGGGRPGKVFIWKGEATRLAPLQPGRRTCLGCGNPFASKDAGNRICPTCAKANARAASCGAFDEPASIRYH